MGLKIGFGAFYRHKKLYGVGLLCAILSVYGQYLWAVFILTPLANSTLK